MEARNMAFPIPTPPTTMEQVLAMAAYDPFTDRPSPTGAREYMQQMAESMDAIKEVLTFMAAQEAMDMFGTNQAAKNLYARIINAGLRNVFQR